MTSIHEKLQIKRVPIDKWSTREQLCLASAVVRSGDQNWSSVSRSLKPFAEPNRPPDWFSQKNCAAQYGSLLENVETPKRKKRPSGQLESLVETPGESILKKLVLERKIELKKKIEEERLEYFKLKEEINTIKQGTASESVIASMCLEIDQEKKQKEQEALAHSEWLKNREERKQELERVFRSTSKVPQPIIGQKRKASESIESIIGIEAPPDESVIESSKPALSPLLTSLLKTPSSLPNVSSSILHSAITSQRVTSPTIASLLNSSASVPVSPSLQQLVSTAISQEPTPPPQIITVKSTPKPQEIIEDTTLSIDSIHKVEKVVKEEVKEEEEKVKEEIKEVVKEKEEVVEEKKEEVKEEPVVEKEEEKEEEIEEEVKETKKEEEVEIKEEPEESSPIEDDDPAPEHDVYDFDESSNKTDNDESAKETTTEASVDSEPETKEETSEESKKEEPIDIKTEVTKFLEKKKENEAQPGSVEIVEVMVMEDDDSDKEMNKKVSEIKCDLVRDKSKEKEMIHSIDEAIYSQKEEEEKDSKDTDSEEPKEKSENLNIDIDVPESSHKSAFTPEYTEAYFDMAIEVTKLDKSGKAKRDYSRTKKKEEKDIDILLAVEKAVNASMEENDVTEETGSEIDSQDSDKKSDTSTKKVKDNQERSNSPWTEEEEVSFIKSKRRYSTPATPTDSVPNSPASSIAYDDDRDYKAWKKSVMLVYSRLAAHKYASLFLKPITDDTAPGYHTIVYRPMDLQTLRKNIENGSIRTTAEFQRDVLLMFNNALMYNKSNDHVYNMARKMQQEGLQEIQILFQAQAPIETPLRRETRTSESGFKRKRAQDDLMRSKKRRDE